MWQCLHYIGHYSGNGRTLVFKKNLISELLDTSCYFLTYPARGKAINKAMREPESCDSPWVGRGRVAGLREESKLPQSRNRNSSSPVKPEHT